MSTKVRNIDLAFLPVKRPNFIASASKLANRFIKVNDQSKENALQILRDIISEPAKYLSGETAEFARMLMDAEIQQIVTNYTGRELRPSIPEYANYGDDTIEPQTIEQMNNAMRLPISVAGALMPDAHLGSGLPIGGVLATEPNTIIPYAVGVDIACRMCLSIYAIEPEKLVSQATKFEKALLENTKFGMGGQFETPMKDDLFDHPDWNLVPFIKNLRGKAISQVGTSGTGNHFVEWGIVEVFEKSEDLNLEVGTYIALLSHSGSRGFGAAIANHYSRIAMQQIKLPREAQHLAWLDLKHSAGQEYWIGMNLAGEYASTNHHHIHKRLSKALGIEPITQIENHHNFAWKEQLPDGTDIMVHRKGATPAGKGEIGIIPGSCVHPGFVVRGKGAEKSLQSASHGAGRTMSRTQAFKEFTASTFDKELKKAGVKMFGGDIDECPMAYKNIHQVMKQQSELVDVLAVFTPKIVRMADPEKRR